MAFANALREPYKSRLIELVRLVYLHISSIVYVNSLEDEEMMVYSMLLEKSKNLNFENKEKILRCLSILISE